jgi:Na+-transporting methylmalonyl-CoA/oxaloacetate decarboxylase gamma subunit
MKDMENGQAPDEKTLRYLKALVTILTVTMILGFLTIVALFVMRFSAMNQAELPDQISLPDGATASAFTQGDDWFAIVTDEDEILIYSKTTGNLRQRIQITP